MQVEHGTFSRIDLVYRCLGDDTRTAALKAAIEAVVQPGTVVADLGTGTGILAIFAAHAGAKRVYAIEISPLLVEAAKKNVQANGFTDVIKVIEGDAATVDFPERPDVVVAEMLTTGLIDEDHVSVLNSLWERGLVDEQTHFIPCRFSTYVELSQTSFGFYGFEMPVIRHEYPWLSSPPFSPLSRKLLLHSVDFGRRVDPVVDSVLHFAADKDGVANAVRLTSMAHLTEKIQVFDTQFLNAPVVVPLPPHRLRKGDRTRFSVSYIMGRGFSSLSLDLEEDTVAEKARSGLRSTMDCLRSSASSEPPHDPSADVSRQQHALRNLDPDRFVVGLNTSGCRFARIPSECCSHCGQLVLQLTNADVMERFRRDVEEYERVAVPELFICTNGSWFDDRELDFDTRDLIIDRVLQCKHVRSVVLESRPEFVDGPGIKQLRRLRDGGVDVTVGLGFDSLSEDVREFCLNKRIPLESYVDACGSLGSNGIKVCTYVILKPPFLTESEAIDEAVATIKFAFDVNSSSVFLEPLAIQKYTLQEILHQRNLFRPPWLWSVLEVIRQTLGTGRLMIGGQFFIPAPYQLAHNCPQCNPSFNEAFLEFNRNNEEGYENLCKIDCTCRESWEGDLSFHAGDLAARIVQTCRGLSQP